MFLRPNNINHGEPDIMRDINLESGQAIDFFPLYCIIFICQIISKMTDENLLLNAWT